MKNKIVYVLCYDDESEKRARTDFEKYLWARIYRIPEEAQNHLFEGVMYTTELIKLYDEWKDKDYVGTISYKLIERSKFLSDTFEEIVRTIEDVPTRRNIVISLAGGFVGIAFNTVNYSEKVFLDTCNTIGLPIRQEEIYSLTKRNYRSYDIYKSRFVFFNHWMTSPYWMLKYIQFFNNVWLPTIESHPLIWNDSGYPGAIPKDKLLKLTKNVSYYPLHPFINERVVSLFFYFHNIPQI